MKSMEKERKSKTEYLPFSSVFFYFFFLKKMEKKGV